MTSIEVEPSSSPPHSEPTASFPDEAAPDPAPSPAPTLPSAIASVLSSTDHFTALCLPLPFYNVLHEVDWLYFDSPAAVHRAFRTQSLLVHPDKHPLHSVDAQAAFDKLTTAHTTLASHDSAVAYATAFLQQRGAQGRAEEGDVASVVEVEREKERLRKKKADAFQSRLTASLSKRKEREEEERREEAVERVIWGGSEAQQPKPAKAVGDGSDEDDEADTTRNARLSVQRKKKRPRAGAF